MVAASTPRQESSRWEHLRVLVVEDNVATADSLALFLRLHGHEPEIARNGTEAMTAVAKINPHVILLDLGLPRIEDGLAVARRLKNMRCAAQPLLVAITGFSGFEEQQRSVEAGVDLHLVKPVDPAKLLDFFDRYHQVMAEGSAQASPFRP